MPRTTAEKWGWQPYEENKDMPACTSAFEEIVEGRLYPYLKARTQDLISHPNFLPGSVQVRLEMTRRPGRLAYQLNVEGEIINDILCQPHHADALTTRETSRRRALQDLQDEAHRLDAWTRAQVHFVQTALRVGTETYEACHAALLDLRVRFDVPSPDLECCLFGGPPDMDDHRIGFTVSFDLDIVHGWYTCPGCQAAAPDMPSQHNSQGRPMCPFCDAMTPDQA